MLRWADGVDSRRVDRWIHGEHMSRWEMDDKWTERKVRARMDK